MKKTITFMFLFSLTGYFYAQTARVQVIHNSADLAAEFVDVYLNATLLIPNFEFRTASPFIDAPAGVPIDLSVAPPNSTSVTDAIYTATVTLAANETYVIVADGNVSPTGYTLPSSFALEVVAMGREAATNPDNTDVLVHHGATDAPTVDVVETGVGAGTIVDNLDYLEFQGYLELTTADYVLEVRDETGVVVVAAYQAPLATLSLNGAALVIVASGFLDPSQNSNGDAFGLYVALPAGGALIQLPPASLGVEGFDKSSFVAYPNPVNDQLNFELSSLDIDELEVRIIDMQGRAISNLVINSANTALDVSALSSGLYQVIITDGVNILDTKKLIKN
ncbi:MAG: hypothetical protein ACI85B_001390 [Flavobacteriaceae bacterium]|jgi:hypothetical protein